MHTTFPFSRLLVPSMLVLATSAVAQQQAVPGIDSIFTEWDRTDSPGCALGIVQDARLVYTRGYGMADLEREIPISADGVFYIASVSKQITAATIALLAQQGHLSLDDDVRRYVPELPSYGPTITIRHLVHHTSGLRDYLTLMALADMPLEDEHPPEDILELVARQRALNFEPGQEYLYSNTGYFLIPIIVHRITGQPIREYAKRHLFEPLGMHETRFHDDYTAPVANRVYSYRASDDGFELSLLPKFDQVGSGGVLTTVRDLVRWDQNFYDGTVGGQQLLDLLHTRGILNTGDTLTYAFGLQLGEYKGLRTVGHGGSMMGFRTQLLRFPDQRFTVICLCNLGEINPSTLARRVADIYLAEPFTQRLAEYAGEYHSPELGVRWTYRVEGGDLLLTSPTDTAVVLTSQRRDAFRLPRGADVVFERAADTTVTGFLLDAGRARGIRFERRKD